MMYANISLNEKIGEIIMARYGKYIEERFKGKEPILEAIKHPGIKRTPEEQARAMLKSFVLIDRGFYNVLEGEFGTEKAKELHKNLWIRWVPELVNDSMEILRINEVKDIPTLGRLLRVIYDLTSCSLFTLEDTWERFVGTTYMDPFAEFLPLFGEKIGSPYCKSLAEASKARLKHIVKSVDMGDMADADQDKFMCLGNSFSRIIIRKIIRREDSHG